jgi:uncharacterized protein (DUF983 family)
MNLEGTISTDEKAGQLLNDADQSVALKPPPTIQVGIRRGISRKCPACGRGQLFSGYLSVLPICPVCGNDNEQYPSDDFAPYVTIFLVLHLLVPVLIAIDRTWNIPVFWEMTFALPLFLSATLSLLPFVKGATIGFACSRGVTRIRLSS